MSERAVEIDQSLSLHLELDRRINFAMQQNDVPVVKLLRVENLTGEPLRDLEIRIVAEPEFAPPWSTRIDLLVPGQSFATSAIDLGLSPPLLAELTERMRGRLVIEVANDRGILARGEHSVELLAADEWGGIASLPEILAAFVTPNHPAVAQVLGSAADLLARSTGDPSLSGYQTRDRKRVLATATALFTAIRNLDIRYAVPPASFEEEGQRVRLPGRIAEERLATCLDLALFAAACLEQAGLHPLVNLVQGHAFAGVWLDEECFADSVVDDPLRIRKRVELGEICLFDPTCVTNRPVVDFERSITEAMRKIEQVSEFVCAIDITRARKGRIRPLTERVERSQNATDAASTLEPTRDLELPRFGYADTSATPTLSTVHAEPETRETRLDRWCRKLLDLTMRNRLLNFKETKRSIPLLCSDLAAFEDMLAEGAVFQIHPRPRDLAGADPRDPEAHWRRTGDDALRQLFDQELRAKRIRVDLTPEEMERRLIETYRAARLGLEEGGASGLYLAIGFLAWTESKSSENRRFAPILLLPLELHRKSVREGFSIRLGDEDARVNVTLLEMLRREHGITIPGLDPLPEDESGLDVPGILNAFRHAVRDIDRWEVIEAARVGLFSFSKFLMWRDLSQRLQDLLKNPVVDHLVNRPGQPFDDMSTFPSADRLDEERPLSGTFCPLPADSSQLAAVFAAADGKSFVLEGPPGTGKSQTITNLIAHCLAEGKSVLFVSEKMAALEVVQSRLQQIGLGGHCLELHSNKAHKRTVIGQLYASLQRIAKQPPESWEREAHRLEGLRRELNEYVRVLHKRWPSGDSAFRAVSKLIELRDVGIVALRWDAPDAIDADALAGLRDRVDRLQTAARQCGPIFGHAWEHVRRSEWTPGWQQEVLRAASQLEEAIATLDAQYAEVARALRLDSPDPSTQELSVIRDVADLLLSSPSPPPAILVRPDWDEIHERIGVWIEHGRRRDSLRETLYARYTDGLLTLDVAALSSALRAAENSWGPIAWWRRRPVRKAYRSVAKDRKAPPKDELAGLLRDTKRLQEEEAAVSKAGDEARELLGRFWKDGEAEWSALQGLRDWARRFRVLAQRLAGEDIEKTIALREHWSRLATEGRELLAPEASVGRALVNFRSAYDGFRSARDVVTTVLDLDAESCWGPAETPGALGRARGHIHRWRASTSSLRDWCAWRRERGEAVDANLASLIAACEEGRVRPEDLSRTFERSYYEWWLAAVMDREPILSRFVSHEHERKIRQFRELDAAFMDLTREFVEARLAERAARSLGQADVRDEIAVIKREGAKRQRHIPVRSLFQRIPTLLPHLKPCLLMSPMSVAQYLDPAHPPFDLVVFDEASQIPIWDAIGALARGRQAVIVGDPKQLPPTNFFMKSDQDEGGEPDDLESLQSLESVLDDCLAANLPWLRLDWHYRSKHESLIAFSNYHYYDNRLITFPAADRIGAGVSWRHVAGGIYDRGKSRTNRAEAEAVVQEIVERLLDPKRSQQSIGVVTFNLAQQVLIENLLEEARRNDPRIDAFFAEDQIERPFVKNLENVQGDERDVILFSICFGPDAQGRVAMHFGPLNLDGGERRLNVAVTRARREVVVFSTLRAEQIDLARTRARGVKDLKAFLEYAERGPAALGASFQFHHGADFDSPFEKAVHDALVERGWTVHLQVGCSGYRIDLAVVDPKRPGRYLLGIECDGANYHSARTARDRDRLREAVLRDLGWEIHRIWSTDWWQDPRREIEKVEAVLRGLVS